MSYANSPHAYKTTLIIPKILLLLVTNVKRKSLKCCHLLIIGRASILIPTIIISTIIAVLICRSLGKRRGRSSKTTKASLLLCNTTDMGVHLTQLIIESVKESIHALKLCHDSLESHTTTQRRSGGGRNDGG